MVGILLDDADFFCGADDDGLIDGTAEAVTVDRVDLREGVIVGRLLDCADFFCDGDDDDGLSDGTTEVVAAG